MIEFKLNGEWVTTKVAPETRLLDLLRDEFSLMGTKEGCGEGECGACSVLINGRLATSCLVPVISVRGESVVTMEGFAETLQYKMLEECYAQTGAVQCGFCTPGMILASHAVLSANANPSEAEIKDGLSGNLCRCTGYNMIIDAVLMAAKKGKGLW